LELKNVVTVVLMCDFWKWTFLALVSWVIAILHCVFLCQDHTGNTMTHVQ
jgi:uncharacterized protein YpmS